RVSIAVLRSCSFHLPYLRVIPWFFYLSLSTVRFSAPPPPTDIYTPSLHDALPISLSSNDTSSPSNPYCYNVNLFHCFSHCLTVGDRKSTRLNSSHVSTSYAVFCLKKKNRQSRYAIHQRTQCMTRSKS